jgi:hypothetical protein
MFCLWMYLLKVILETTHLLNILNPDCKYFDTKLSQNPRKARNYII